MERGKNLRILNFVLVGKNPLQENAHARRGACKTCENLLIKRKHGYLQIQKNVTQYLERKGKLVEAGGEKC
jgi:hypothetical protein